VNRSAESRVTSTFARMEADAKKYHISVLRRVIPVWPGVFSPKYFSDVEWFAKHVPKMVGKRSFLEIGTGTGVIALFVGLQGARRMVLSDINPTAVTNAEQTLRMHHLAASVRCGDVFRVLRPCEKFDVIFWNHPFHCSSKKARTILQRGGYDYRYLCLSEFFREARRHLTPKGKVLLATSKNARLDLIEAFADRYGYLMQLVKQEAIPSRRRRGVSIDVRIYSFRPRRC
jgi:release factor glutamine methyltransferase